MNNECIHRWIMSVSIDGGVSLNYKTSKLHRLHSTKWGISEMSPISCESLNDKNSNENYIFSFLRLRETLLRENVLRGKVHFSIFEMAVGGVCKTGSRK